MTNFHAEDSDECFGIYFDKWIQVKKGRGWLCCKILRLIVEIHKQENNWYKIGLRIMQIKMCPSKKVNEIITLTEFAIW